MKVALGVCVVAVALASGAAGQSAQNKVQWNLRLNDTRGPIRTADVSPVSQGAVSEILGGPTNGSENAYLLYTRMAPGAHGPALFTLPVEHYYVVLSGKMTVQIGTDTFTAEPMTGPEWRKSRSDAPAACPLICAQTGTPASTIA